MKQASVIPLRASNKPQQLPRTIPNTASFSNRISLLVSLALVFLVSGGATRLVMNETGTRVDFTLKRYKIVVQVSNRLYGTNFTIHCKSKDNDLGTHVVGPEGNYQFKFRANFWGTTLFFCGVSWAKGWIVFYIFSIRRDYRRCPTYCWWVVLGDGLYGYRQKDKVCDLKFPFKNKPPNPILR